MDIAVLLYDRFTALDAVRPYEVLTRLPGATVTFVATAPGPKTTDTGRLTLLVDTPCSELEHPRTRRCSSGSATRTRPASGRHRCAPAR